MIFLSQEDAETCPEYPSVTECFAPFYDDPETSDILVKAGDKEIHAHKIILSAQSALFRAMFQVYGSAFGIHHASLMR